MKKTIVRPIDWHLLLFFPLLVLSLGFSHAYAGNIGTIKGRVIDNSTKQGVIRATIILSEINRKARTDTSGYFTITDVKEGKYTILISYVGYKDKMVNDITVLPGKSTYVEIEIQESHLDLGDVTVNAHKYDYDPITPVSTYSFSRDEISQNPGAQGDIFRAIGMLPGVSSSGGEYSAIAVRGQGTRDNVYMVDDIPITQVSHLEQSERGAFNDPNGGRFSIFAPRVINSAEFEGAGLAAQYGRRSASYLGLSIKEGNHDSYIIDGQLDLLGATINYDGPSYLFDNTTLFISGRYQNFGPVINLINRKDAGLPIYGDLIAKSTSQLNGNTKLSLIVMHSPESIVRDVSNVAADAALNRTFTVNGTNTKDLYGINLLSLTSDRSYWKNIAYYTKTSLTSCYGHTYPDATPDGKLLNSTIPWEDSVQLINHSESELGYRSIFSITSDNKSSLTAGFDADRIQLQTYRKLSRPDTLYVFGPNDHSPSQYYLIVDPKYYNTTYDSFAYNASLYIDYSFTTFSILTVNTGLRYDYSGFAVQNSLSPRISLSWQLDESNSINGAAGLYYQDPVLSEIADQGTNQRLQEERVASYVLGYKTYFNPDTKLTVEGWYKKLDHLVVRPLADETFQTNSGDGWASGFDINVTKRLTDGVHGSIGYSYMQSKRNDHDGLGEYNFTYSQPHQLSCLAAYKPDDTWIFSAKFKYATGKPTDRYLIHSNIFNDINYFRYSEETIGKSLDRLSDFISLDVRGDYTFHVRDISVSAFIDIVNILNRQNDFEAFLNSITGKIYYDVLGIFPTFGLKFQF